MVYNLTAIVENSTDVVGMVQGVNNVLMEGWLGTLLLVGITVVMFMAFTFVTDDAGKSAGTSFFIGFLISLMFRALSLINDVTMFTYMVIAFAIIAFSFKARR